MTSRLTIDYLSIEDLQEYGKNAKLHPREQIEQIKKSIEEYGFDDPIAIDENNVIIEGHGRLIAAKELGLNAVPVIYLRHLTEEQKKAYRIAHNKINMNSGFDMQMLQAELNEILSTDITVEALGFDENELDEILQSVEDVYSVDDITDIYDEREDINNNTHYVEEDEFDHDEAVSNVKEPRTQEGDIWILGRHRLMCGSSTDEKDVSRLMNGNKAKILFTSPPYADMREYNGGKDLSVDNLSSFIARYKPYTDYQCVNLGIQRKKHEIVQYWDKYIDVARQSGYKLMAWNIWDKTKCGSIGQQSAFFPIRHEWVFVFGTEYFEINKTWEKKETSIGTTSLTTTRQPDGTMKYNSRGNTFDRYKQMESVLSVCSETGDIRKEHPATFPVKLPFEYIISMTEEGDNVIESFGGSGTTLIACEQSNRNCYIMELDTTYCDVIVNRWEALTGKKARKEA